MGYNIEQIETQFFMKKKDFKKALKAIQDLRGRETVKDSSGSHFRWVSNDFFTIDKLVPMLDDWRWDVELDQAGNICELIFTGEKSGDDFAMFSAIAPWVQEGSFIKMQGEDGDQWLWKFDGRCCERVCIQHTLYNEEV